MDGDTGPMAVLHGPDDVLGAPGRVAAEEDAGASGLVRYLVHHGHVPFSELDFEVALDPGERVLLADGEDHIVGRIEDGIDGLRFSRLRVPLAPLKLHRFELSVFVYEARARVIDDNLEALFFGVFDL